MYWMIVKLMSYSVSTLISTLGILIVILLVNLIIVKIILQFVPKGCPGKLHVAFFHPFCNDGGGGERVLWCAIKAIQSKYPNVRCYVYTGTSESQSREIMDNVRHRFNIILREEPKFVSLKFTNFVEAKYHPFCTLLMQSLCSVFLGAEALSKFKPDIYIDTMGYAFTYPLFRFLGGCKVASYTHYPTISTDMLEVVSQRSEQHNNRGYISRNIFLSYLKLIYYYFFAVIYGLTGSCAHVVMVNSSWTSGHISALWKFCSHIETVFPPCNVEKFQELPLIPEQQKQLKTIISIAQFRPEKNIPAQLRAFKKLVELVDAGTAASLRLVLIGGVRNQGDARRVEELKQLAMNLQINDKIIWRVNASFETLVDELKNGTVGIHTMWNEHFGIGIVESMASGLIMVAHDSGGPKMDIIIPFEETPVGFLASSELSYAATIKKILDMSDWDKMVIRRAARDSTSRFSEETFQKAFLACMKNYLDSRKSQ